ncbi:hypothetical protein C8N46_107137 [Kordia periserrulae]|uniref:Uncharacterized protein n=1 Tax=Kordia periserrulae TaxID=701523 RepID=A0A2T6BVN9_9FLAO|nr:hypothetical protein [Kordia periserrulae]PTX60131.1 hypothetical protein C8N46_107137 [Kordia periserrulae]
MKKLKLVPLFLFAFLVSSYTCIAQETEEEVEEAVEEIEVEEEPAVITATYTSMEGTSFVFTYIDEDGEESEITFEKMAPDVKKAFNLADKSLLGKKFKITYTTENITDDDDEDMLVSIRVIIAMEKL